MGGSWAQTILNNFLVALFLIELYSVLSAAEQPCPTASTEGPPVVYSDEEIYHFRTLHFESRRLFPLLELLPTEAAYFYTQGYQTYRMRSSPGVKRKKRDADSPPASNNVFLRNRKEIRQLSPQEWKKFTFILEVMKNSPSGGASRAGSMSEYDMFANHYTITNAPGAGSGSASLPWHREFLKRFEDAIGEHSIGTAIPYWDSALDEPLPNPADSVVWSDELFGNSVGLVSSGPFVDWTVTSLGCQELIGEHLQRNIQKGNSRYLFSPQKIRNHLLSKKNYSEIAHMERPDFYHDSDAVQFYVGGHMSKSACAPHDPVFWLHQAYVDLLWEEFRSNHQDTDPASDYPEDAYSYRKAFDPMTPFEPMVNIHGLSPHYFLYYNYSERPSRLSCTEDAHCLSKYLWCNTADGCRCVSKVKVHGDCTGLPSTACYCADESITPRCMAGMCTCKPVVVRVIRKK